jgi:hypothetical protein
LDYLEVIYENIDKIKPVLDQIKNDIENLSPRIVLHTEKLSGLDSNFPNTRGIINRIISAIAFELQIFNGKFESSLLQLSESI